MLQPSPVISACTAKFAWKAATRLSCLHAKRVAAFHAHNILFAGAARPAKIQEMHIHIQNPLPVTQLRQSSSRT